MLIVVGLLFKKSSVREAIKEVREINSGQGDAAYYNH